MVDCVVTLPDMHALVIFRVGRTQVIVNVARLSSFPRAPWELAETPFEGYARAYTSANRRLCLSCFFLGWNNTFRTSAVAGRSSDISQRPMIQKAVVPARGEDNVV